MKSLSFFTAVFAGFAAFVPIENLHLMVKHRRAKKVSVVLALWQVFLFLLVVEFWVASGNVTDALDTIPKYLLFLLLPIGVTLMAIISKPEFGNDERDEDIEFLHQRFWFFGTLAALPVISVLRELSNGERIAFDDDLLFRALILIGAVVGMFLKQQWPRIVHAVVMIAVITLYMLIVFPAISTATTD